MIDATHNANHSFRIDKLDICDNLKQLRNKYPKNVILSYININSIRNKLGNLNNIILNSIDVITIAETKLDDSFLNSQFILTNYKTPYRLDKSSNSGGLLTYVNSNIPSRR